jgi:hypothetical protein
MCSLRMRMIKYQCSSPFCVRLLLRALVRAKRLQMVMTLQSCSWVRRSCFLHCMCIFGLQSDFCLILLRCAIHLLFCRQHLHTGYHGRARHCNRWLYLRKEVIMKVYHEPNNFISSYLSIGAYWNGSEPRGPAQLQALCSLGHCASVLTSFLKFCFTYALRSTNLIPNHSLKSQINQWREEQVWLFSHMFCILLFSLCVTTCQVRAGR